MGYASYFNLSATLLSCLVWIGIAAYLRRKKKESATYLVIFTIFYAYIIKVLDYTLFRFQSLLLLKLFVPNLMLRGQAAAESLNLTPLLALTPADLKTSLLNILLMIPFGFGLPFITRLRAKKIIFFGALFSISIELLQLMTGSLAKMTFRVADINDVIFNTAGTVIGYMLFAAFARIFRRIFRDRKTGINPILRHVIERPQTDKKSED